MKLAVTPTGLVSPTFRLRVVASSDPLIEDRVFILPAEGGVIGRGEECDVVVQDPSISRQHARLEIEDSNSTVVRDHGSSNGVFVSGRKVMEASIPPGGEFTLGATTFRLETEVEPAEGDVSAFILDRTVNISSERLAGELEAPRPLAEQGEQVTTFANCPFLISDPDSVWMIESGKVDLFTVEVRAGKPAGARTRFLSLGAGEAFFGIDTAHFGHDWGFLAAGKAGSVLRRLDLHDLELFARVPEHRKTISRLVERWVGGLAKQLSATFEPSSSDVLLRAGEECALTPGNVAACAEDGVLWLPMPAAFFLFNGALGLSPELEGVLFPLAPQARLELVDSDTRDPKVSLVPRATLDSVRDVRLWAGLDAFHRVVCDCKAQNQQVEAAEKGVRLVRKAEGVEGARRAGLVAIEAVLGGTRSWYRSPFERTDLEPVFVVCKQVAESQGIEVRRPQGELDELSFDEQIQVVAAASHFRVRRVALAGDWWKYDQGPMVGQRQADGTPIAIVPGRNGTYRLIDVQTESEGSTLDEELAGRLAPFAYSFYRPFADGPVGARELIRFAVHGLRRDFIVVALAGFAVGVLGTLVPAVTGIVYETAIPQAERSILLELCLGLFLVTLATAAFKVTQNVATLRVQSRMDYSAQAAVWDRLLNLPATFFRQYSAGDLNDRAAAIGNIRSIIAGSGVAAILGLFASLFNAIQMCLYNVYIALVAMGLSVLYVLLTVGCNLLKLRLQREELQQRGRIAGLVLQLINGVAKLRVSGTESRAFGVWATSFAKLRHTSFRIGRISNFVPLINGGFPVLSSLFIFLTVVGLRLKALERGEAFDLSTGEFLAFSAAYGIFLGAMQALGDASLSLFTVSPVYKRLKPILQEKPEVDRSKQPPARLRGQITLSHIFFRYTPDSPYVLKDFSLTIEPGEFVALVGGSGSGKSTLMKIMLGFERPEKGGVYYDGQDLSTLDVRLVRQQLGVVLQESRLLPADIYRNIVGSSNRTVAEAWEAASKAGLADDIKRMPMGMHTYVSEGGGGFSGGQKQRLMIARALVHQPKVLFLDEATSALDNRTQAIVTASMDRLKATRIVVAHRLSTIANAHRICYLENGTIKEMGTYQKLVEDKGAFAELARRQLA